jgi:glycosyltransferase involved in cell wall biosynthesis
MKDMRVSIVIPCHNVQEHLPKALDSALAQDHPDTEIVCVDDGSTDGTAGVLADYAARFPHKVRVITQANKGASAARNVGTAATSGDYLQFLDADDVILPQKIGAQIALARSTASPGLIVGDFEQVMPNGLLLPVLALHDQPWMALIRTRMGTTSANLWKRDALMAVGGWNEELGSSQDYELMFRLLKVDTPLVWDPHIRTHVLKRVSGSISQTGVFANWDRYIALRHSMLEHLHATDRKRYAAEIETLRQYIFMALRIVAVDDLPKALATHKRSIGRGFRPQVGRAITERYAALYNLLGFATTERLMRLLRGRRQQQTTT